MFAMSFAAFGFFSNKEEKPIPVPDRDVAPATQPGTATAVFAGGCFWCTEAVFEQLKGVSDVVSGYAGDTKEKANYETVCSGTTNHAEAIQITYDPSQISYGQLLQIFFATHDPTTKDRQGPDSGHQYRSAVFFASDEQKQVADAYIKQLDKSGAFSKPVVTTIEKLTEFYPAETYHQNFASCNPMHPYIQQQAAHKVEKVRDKFPDKVKKE